MFPVFTPSFHLSFPTYKAQGFPARFPPGRVEVFSPYWDYPVYQSKAQLLYRRSNGASRRRTVGPCATVRVMRPHHRAGVRAGSASPDYRCWRSTGGSETETSPADPLTLNGPQRTGTRAGSGPR